MATYRNGRKLVSVTMTPELHERLVAVCEKQDVPLSVWCRAAIDREVTLAERQAALQA